MQQAEVHVPALDHRSLTGGKMWREVIAFQFFEAVERHSISWTGKNVRVLIPIALRRAPETLFFFGDANTRAHPGQFSRACRPRRLLAGCSAILGA
ncbi:hypothetical protein D3C83_84800 [compost metagenome]